MFGCDIMIRTVKTTDAGDICAIYNHYVTETIISFEEEPVVLSEMEARISGISAKFPWIVFEEDKRILGYAYVSDWKSRRAYRYSVESTIYISPSFTNLKIGTKLYEVLISKLTKMNIHSVIGVIALPNVPSVRLHEKFGFRKVAHLREVGWKFQKWIDVGYWQIIMEQGD